MKSTLKSKIKQFAEQETFEQFEARIAKDSKMSREIEEQKRRMGYTDDNQNGG